MDENQAIIPQVEEDFKTWWHNEGSGITPVKDEDMETFAKRIARIAWINGAYKNEKI